MNKQQIKGRIERAKGKLTEVAGIMTDNKAMEEKGRIGKVLGGFRVRYGDAKAAAAKRLPPRPKATAGRTPS
jgi:uncharacterized protein YjbJ (UPF0337 family)